MAVASVRIEEIPDLRSMRDDEMAREGWRQR